MWFLNLNEGVCYEEMNKPVEKPLVVDVNTLDLHKDAETLNKTTFHLPSFAMGMIVAGVIMVLICVICVLGRQL